MGTGGLGVVDLDGNGFTTNDPSFAKVALVTSQRYYSQFGNSGMGLGNDYAYGAKYASGTLPGSVGLGSNTPIPGVNEGSTGIAEVVRDSQGNARLYPPPDSPLTNITDLEVGDFLDTIFHDRDNLWAHESLHLSMIHQYPGASNNFIATPPTPNPPPLTLPVAMGATTVLLDPLGQSEEGAFVIMGKEVFTMDIRTMGIMPALDTGFVHLLPAQLAGSPVDEPFPPNPSTLNGLGLSYMNTGPVAESSTVGCGAVFGSRQQIGNFLFVADKGQNQVAVLNSNTMERIAILSGLSAPDSVAVTSDLKRLFVSNSGSGQVSVFDVDPRTGTFLDRITDIRVGHQPKGICCQPDGEDVFVCNFGESTVSIVDPKTMTVRKTLKSRLNKPWDMVAGPRQVSFGFHTSVYHGYISNHGGDNVLIFESGPDGFGGIGYDDILGAAYVNPKVGHLPIESPRGICWDPRVHRGLLAGNCCVAHQSAGYAMVSRVGLVKSAYGALYLDPNEPRPCFRDRLFAVIDQWGGPVNPVLSGAVATDVAFPDFNLHAWMDENWVGSLDVTNLGDLGQNPQINLPENNKHPCRVVYGKVLPTWNPDALFISFQHTPVIDMLNPVTGNVVKTITGLPAGARVLRSYF